MIQDFSHLLTININVSDLEMNNHIKMIIKNLIDGPIIENQDSNLSDYPSVNNWTYSDSNNELDSYLPLSSSTCLLFYTKAGFLFSELAITKSTDNIIKNIIDNIQIIFPDLCTDYMLSYIITKICSNNRYKLDKK